MNADEILRILNEDQVDYLLIGGMNFLLRHLPELTWDVDIWVKDDAENLARLNRALEHLGAEWGRTETEWQPVVTDWHWLQAQEVFCLTTAHGALDVFRDVRGLEGRYRDCQARGIRSHTATGIPFTGLSDEDMLGLPGGFAGRRTQGAPDAGAAGSHSTVEMTMTMKPSALKEQEERKREAAYHPVTRWLHIQQTIKWAEANLPPHLRRNRPRTHKVLPKVGGPLLPPARN